MKNFITTYFFAFALGIGAISAQTYVVSVGNYDLEGESAFLGVRSDDISREKAKKLGFSNYYGDYVTKVIKNTAAEKAGIQPFDYIFKLDEKETTSSRRLGDLLDNYSPGDQVKISYYRRGKVQSVNATLGTRATADYASEKKEKPFLGVSQIGTSSANSDLDGVSVSIISNSTAEAMGMRRGDMIAKINGFTILDWNDISTAVNTLRVGESVRVDFY
ncbi:MAG: PDZ domain-containing protein, partial [Bacteroidota bacterium]